MLRYGETFGINSPIVRPFNIDGHRQTGEGAMSNFSRRHSGRVRAACRDDLSRKREQAEAEVSSTSALGSAPRPLLSLTRAKLQITQVEPHQSCQVEPRQRQHV
jgi:hypothetical protein